MDRLLTDCGILYPLYSIWSYTDSIYKIVRHKTAPAFLGDRSRKGVSTCKFDSSLSRARSRVLELGLCNHWDYFCTFTLDKEKYDRFDLDAWYKDFSQWLRDQRKKESSSISYVLVPEQHKDGAWHIHGLISGVSSLCSFRSQLTNGENVPSLLADAGYYNWPAYQKKFGFCSLAPIRNEVAVCFYILKYISKSLGESSVVGQHLYYCSRGLTSRNLHSSVYEPSADLDSFITSDFEFCAVGWTHENDCLDWTFGLNFGDCDAFPDDVPEEVSIAIKEVDQFIFSQMSFL